ncbi:hypothetical protein [Sphingomonas sp. CLY1604]|uniref:hypothetical protein n=1 Tax=Sphingomonas sp. CLY1604 TaxID=3457786 RepID=UPI003FD8B044
MRKFLLPGALCAAALVGCSDPDSSSRQNGVDVAAAASRAQTDIANYAATPATAPTARATVATPAATVTPAPLPDDAPPEAVVGRYVAALSAGRYDEAWSLWDSAGAPAGMNRAALAARFDRYAGFKATVGTPFDPDAGAGQRYITVPVTITGTERSGKPFRLTDNLVLHKAADGIPSDDPHVHAWRIRNSEMASRPNVAPTVAR